ncbi:MAG: hypothetical protein H8M99_12645 [Gloeobacteraceae cyanobacterium ES-bin-144]|nr:hypothetical protein [Verrucomicrobiales bacterium]
MRRLKKETSHANTEKTIPIKRTRLAIWLGTMKKQTKAVADRIKPRK